MNNLAEYKKKNTIRYKTEICKKWESGFCEFGDKCAFAHGSQDIRGKSCYKTKKCRQFFENGFCMFGNKCLFQHFSGYSALIEGNDDLYTMANSDKGENTAKLSMQKQRLPVFQQISS